MKTPCFLHEIHSQCKPIKLTSQRRWRKRRDQNVTPECDKDHKRAPAISLRKAALSIMRSRHILILLIVACCALPAMAAENPCLYKVSLVQARRENCWTSSNSIRHGPSP